MKDNKILMEVLAHCLLAIRDAADAGLKTLHQIRGGNPLDGEEEPAEDVDKLLDRLDPPTFGKKHNQTHDDEEAKE